MIEQLHLFDVGDDSGRIIKTVSTNLGPFGNRTDLIVVRGDTLGGASLIECDNPDALYFNQLSHFDAEQQMTLLNLPHMDPPGPDGPLTGPLDPDGSTKV